MLCQQLFTFTSVFIFCLRCAVQLQLLSVFVCPQAFLQEMLFNCLISLHGQENQIGHCFANNLTLISYFHWYWIQYQHLLYFLQGNLLKTFNCFISFNRRRSFKITNLGWRWQFMFTFYPCRNTVIQIYILWGWNC